MNKHGNLTPDEILKMIDSMDNMDNMDRKGCVYDRADS